MTLDSIKKMEAKLYNQTGQEQGTIELPAGIFGVKWNADLVNQVVLSMRSNQRQGTAHTKNRGEVSGGGKKPWRQKGTGRARHGSIRSPIWRHGGVTHGPRVEKDYSRTITKKMRTKALFSVLSAKLREGELLLVDHLSLPQAKTKHAEGTLKNLASIAGFEKMNYKKGKRALFALPEQNTPIYKSFRNIASVATEELRNLNPVDALRYQYLIMVDPHKSLEQLARKLN